MPTIWGVHLMVSGETSRDLGIRTLILVDELQEVALVHLSAINHQ